MMATNTSSLAAHEIGVAASQLQSLAADPTQNIWVNASAGTGKTKVLTERVLRLLLPRDGVPDGTPPQNILSITFTKAGANEMITRVMSILSEWAICDEGSLKDTLTQLLGQDPGIHQIDRARRLFASIIDLPGGLNITTIHAFCQSILGRFVIEANLPPNFSVMEDGESQALIQKVRDEFVHDVLNDKTNPLVKQSFLWLSSAKASGDMNSILQSLLKDRKSLTSFFATHPDYHDYLRHQLNVPNDVTSDGLFHHFFSDDVFPRKAIQQLAQSLEHGTDNNIKTAASLYQFCGDTVDDRFLSYNHYKSIFLKQKNEPAKRLVTAKVKAYDPTAIDIVTDEAERILTYEDQIKSLQIYQATCHLLDIAQDIIHRYGLVKLAEGKIDYDDLIHKTHDLLKGHNREWVLYKLDYNIDHILLDEAQDTSPDQWDILKAILQEFTSGQSVREDETPRTLFVVGDRKQSIFNFQGADPKVFNQTHDDLHQQMTLSGQSWHDVPMNTSFRSTTAVLSFVDRVFQSDELKSSLTQNGSHYQPHTAFRQGHAGCIELWPIYKAPKQSREPWALPLEIMDTHNGMKHTANRIADQIHEWITKDEILQSKGRAIQAGDIMILVRRRNAMVDHLVRALKSHNIPVSGVDRLKISGHIAVKDIIVALQFALMPSDDLALACLLKSPFIGWDDAMIEDYAYHRDKQTSLWQQIKTNAPSDICQWLSELIEKTSGKNAFTATSDLLNMPSAYDKGMNGWSVFLSRIGEDCRDPLEELLSMAQRHDTNNPATGIQGFIHDIINNSSEIKREMEDAGNKVRIMTVHASKGLQAPIVILPDTTGLPQSAGKSKDGLLWVNYDFPLWSPTSDADNTVVTHHKDLLKAAAKDEYYRLLYVAMTRAEDRLIVTGTLGGGTKKLNEASWYALMENAIRPIGTIIHPPAILSAADSDDIYFDHEANIDYIRYETDQTAPIKNNDKDHLDFTTHPLPQWVMQPPKPEHYPPRILKPSQDQEEAIPARSPLRQQDDSYRFRRGILTHALLQYLPDIDGQDRARAGQFYLDRQAPDISVEVKESILQETLAILNDPDFAAFFGEGSMAEIPITGTVKRDNGKTDIISGQIDRMLVTDDAIWIVDFKSNRPPPRDDNKIPVQYRNQLAAYKTLVQGIYPNHVIHCALLWTDGPFMTIVKNA